MNSQQWKISLTSHAKPYAILEFCDDMPLRPTRLSSFTSLLALGKPTRLFYVCSSTPFPQSGFWSLDVYFSSSPSQYPKKRQCTLHVCLLLWFLRDISLLGGLELLFFCFEHFFRSDIYRVLLSFWAIIMFCLHFELLSNEGAMICSWIFTSSKISKIAA